jgi:hypothetical protein
MANKFVVSPMIHKINLKAGETYTGEIVVANPKASSNDFYFKAVLSPYTVNKEDYSPDFVTVSDWSKIVDWITIENPEGVLKPNDTQKVRFSIKVPENAPAGGQYAKIGIVSNEPVNTTTSGVVQNVIEMASLIYADIEGETIHDGKILDTSISGFVALGKPMSNITVSNNGNVHETLTSTLSVKNVITGETILPTENIDGVYENLIMPETTRTVTRDLEVVPALGIFEVKQEVTYLGEHSEISTIMVVCPLWFMILVAATFISIISMIFYGRHLKRKKKEKHLHFENTNVNM